MRVLTRLIVFSGIFVNLALLDGLDGLHLAAVHNLVALGLNVSGLRERPLGERRADQLIHQHGEQHDVSDQPSLVAAQLAHHQAHAQRHARLRKKRDAPDTS